MKNYKGIKNIRGRKKKLNGKEIVKDNRKI